MLTVTVFLQQHFVLIVLFFFLLVGVVAVAIHTLGADKWCLTRFKNKFIVIVKLLQYLSAGSFLLR